VGAGAAQNTTARVTNHEQITPDINVTKTTNVSENQRQVIQVEYLYSRDISIVALLDENGTFGVDFKIRKRFK
ncbi:MAG: hypothetical protein ACRD5G_17140, partial [Candidatus Acidiferrales bacterium]